MDIDEIKLSFQERQLVVMALLARANTLWEMASLLLDRDEVQLMRDEATRHELLAEKLR